MDQQVGPRSAAVKRLVEPQSGSNVNQVPRRYLLNEVKSTTRSYFFNPFKSIFLWVFVSSHLVLALLLGNLRSIAPDEGTYLDIFHKVYATGYSTADALGFHGTQEWFLRIAYYPAHLMELLGLKDYLAIRIHAIFFSAVSVYLLLVILKIKVTKTRSFLLYVVVSIPSVFLWMTLGLREGFLFLSFSFICTGIDMLVQSRNRMAFAFLLLGNFILFETKPILFLIVSGALGLALIYNLIKNLGYRHAQLILALSIVIPVTIFPSGLTLPFHRVQLESAASLGTGDVLSMEIKSNPSNLIVKLLVKTGLDDKFTNSGNKVDNKNQEQRRSSRLDLQPAGFTDLPNVVVRSLEFLFKPFPLIDNGSIFANILSLELPFWIFLYWMTFIAILSRLRSKVFDELFIFVLSFNSVFIYFSAVTEVNVGTALRHRSVLMIPALFLILRTWQDSQRVD